MSAPTGLRQKCPPVITPTQSPALNDPIWPSEQGLRRAQAWPSGTPSLPLMPVTARWSFLSTPATDGVGALYPLRPNIPCQIVQTNGH